MKTRCLKIGAMQTPKVICVGFALMSAKAGQGSIEVRQMELSEQGKGAVNTAKIIN